MTDPRDQPTPTALSTDGEDDDDPRGLAERLTDARQHPQDHLAPPGDDDGWHRCPQAIDPAAHCWTCHGPHRPPA